MRVTAGYANSGIHHNSIIIADLAIAPPHDCPMMIVTSLGVIVMHPQLARRYRARPWTAPTHERMTRRHRKDSYVRVGVTRITMYCVRDRACPKTQHN